MTPENAVKKDILEWLNFQAGRCMVFAIYNGGIRGRTLGMGRRKGIPDILGIWCNKPLAIEVKAPGGMASRDQLEFLDEWKKKGGIGIVAESLYEVVSALNAGKGLPGKL